MSIKTINVGAVQNDGTGDPLRDAFGKVNENFAELDLLKAPKDSPALTGTPTAPTQAADNNTTRVATTAFVVGQAATVAPVMAGAAAVGASLRFARQDHRHPTDTTRAPLESPAFTGTPTGITKTHVGLGNVDNTSDANKPISTATQAALNGKQASLGFTPVQQGGPTGQGSNKVFIGWATDSSGLLCQVDGTNFGKSWPINVTGTAARVVNPYVSSAVEQAGDIGSAYVAWDAGAVPAVQVDAPRSNAAYMIWRATHWGVRHIAAMHVYEGNMTVTMSVGALNNFIWDGSGNFTAAGNVTALSDIRLKTDLTKIEGALGKVCTLNGYTYTRKDTGQRQTGVVAQELQEVLPEAVIDNGEHLAVAYGNIVGLLIEAIKELKAEVDQLKGK